MSFCRPTGESDYCRERSRALSRIAAKRRRRRKKPMANHQWRTTNGHEGHEFGAERNESFSCRGSGDSGQIAEPERGSRGGSIFAKRVVD